MALNDPTLASYVRAPRGLAIINGQYADAFVECEVDNNSFYQADTFRATFALSGQLPAMNWAWWVSQASIEVELLVGFPADPEKPQKSELQSWIYGLVDNIEFDPVMDEIVISGRDMTSVFIDAQTTEKFQNLTSSAIAKQLADRHGLAFDGTATTTKVGKYYEIDHARLTAQMSEWDLLTFLAHEENFDVWVTGKTLHFQPKVSPSDNPYVIHWDRDKNELNGMSLKLSRALTISKGIIVQVRSWNQKQKKGFTVKREATHRYNEVLKNSAQPVGNAQTYVFTVPNLTTDQAIKYAEARLHELSRHEMRLDASLPGDEILTTRTIVQLVGTDTEFDQIYYPDSIIRNFSMSAGCTMDLSAKNHNVESTVLA